MTDFVRPRRAGIAFAIALGLGSKPAVCAECTPPCPIGETCTEERMCALESELVGRESIRRHDGLFLRFGLGAGYLSGDVDDRDHATEGSLGAAAQLGEFLLGGTIADGLVLGGGLWGMNAPSPSYDGTGHDSANQVGQSSVDLRLTSSSQLGPFLVFYPDATRGLHGMVAPTLAFSLLGASDEPARYQVDRAEGIGWGLILGAGWDLWIAEQWSIGLSARFQYFSTTFGSADPASRFSALVSGVLATGTWH